MNDPQHDLPPELPVAPSGNNTASRGKRLLAAMVDGFVSMAISFPVFAHFGIWEAMKTNAEVPQSTSIGLTLFSLALFFILHGYFLYHYGQTLGKRIVGLAIVTLDGHKPSFASLILNRYLPQWVAGLVPVVGPMLALGDVIYILLSADNRCVHDLIAKTKVIDLSVKVAIAPNSIIA